MFHSNIKLSLLNFVFERFFSRKYIGDPYNVIIIVVIVTDESDVNFSKVNISAVVIIEDKNDVNSSKISTSTSTSTSTSVFEEKTEEITLNSYMSNQSNYLINVISLNIETNSYFHFVITILELRVCLSNLLIIKSVCHNPIRYVPTLYLSVSIYSKKLEPWPSKGQGRKSTPFGAQKYLSTFYTKVPIYKENLLDDRQVFISIKCQIILNSSILNYRTTIDDSCWTGRKILILSGDVESNPGPETTLVTQNTRGLKKESKLRQLLNRIYKSHSSSNNLIIALQETHIESVNLKYTWKGNNIFTPGNGYQGGCITLLSENIEVLDQINIGQEAHIAKVNIVEMSRSYLAIVINLHAPCAHNQHKIDFFKKIRESIDSFQRNEISNLEIFMLGDFNFVNKGSERINTIYSKAEQRIGKEIEDIFNDLMLTNCWDDKLSDMTWRHGCKMSRIDRIYWSQNITYEKKKTSTDWTYTESDHSAVIVNLSDNRNYSKSKITRLDTRFMQSTKLKYEFLKGIKERYDQLNDTDMDPHQRLEFLKMSIRSLALETSANEKKRVEEEMSSLKKDIEFWQRTYENDASGHFSQLTMTNLNELMAKRDKILNERGEYLSQRVKTKWYQEGEKSTKYFLNLQKAKSKKTEMSELMVDGIMIVDNEKIKENVELFYKNLYEKGDSKIINEGKIDEFLDGITKLDQDKINMMDGAITIHDVLETLKSCSDSAPGPDGIPYSIIKLTWQYFGKLLMDSWELAIKTGNLTHSHRSSYLRLIPKEGKDQTHLKNWRPITLSNCDFKLISKTIAKKLTDTVSDSIGLTQTAYIKGRQITDNLHLMLHTVEKTAGDNMIVSLDAEKAFDSVEHWFIRAILKKLGLEKFINLFNLMYYDQMVDIILNNDKSGSYQIKNGVKQGDALSCILFIICMEPLIKNILNDDSIKSINTLTPKVVAYADDIACMIKPDITSLNGVFKQYERLSEVSGLKLNADKTEIIAKGGPRLFKVDYMHQTYTIIPKDNIKINGLIIGYDVDKCRDLNIRKMYNAIETQLRQWSSRGLSLIGKIQIYKTFGLSQLLYIGSVLMINKVEEKQIDELVYRFLWNNDMGKNKAPDRIKRLILKRPIKKLGFGMIDFKEVIKSIRIKTILRLLNQSGHPLGTIIRNNINNSRVKIRVLERSRDCLDEPIKEIGTIWNKIMKNCDQKVASQIYNIILHEYVGDVIEKKFENKRQGLLYRHHTVLEILNISKTHPILNKLDKNIKRILDIASNTNNQLTSISSYEIIPINDKLLPSNKITSKMIRNAFFKTDSPISAKLLCGIDDNLLSTLGNNLKSLTNSRLKTIILRAVHGDIYAGTRLKKFGMTNTDLCVRCNQQENIEHQLYSCQYVKQIWKLVEKITSIKNESFATILGCNMLHNKTTITLHAEIIRILLAIERPTTPPNDLINQTLTRLKTLEKGVTRYQIDQMHKLLCNLPTEE